MDTRLKRSKKIRSFCYRMIAAGALFAALATGLLGREALYNLCKEGTGTLTGEIYYLTQFREHISFLYTTGMLAYAGVGDDNGHPLTNENAELLSEQALLDFREEAQKIRSDLIYYIEHDGVVKKSNNINFPLFSEYDGHLLLPEDIILCCYWDGESGHLTFFPTDEGLSADPEAYYRENYKSTAEESAETRFLLAIKNTEDPDSHSLRQMTKTAQSYRNILYAFFANAAIFVIASLCCLFSKKAAKQASADYLRLTSKIWLELKLMLIVIWFYQCWYLNLWYFNGSLSYRVHAVDSLWLYLPTGILFYLFYTELAGNGPGILKQTFIYKVLHALKRFIISSPSQRRITGLCLSNILCCIPLTWAGGRLLHVYSHLPIMRTIGILLMIVVPILLLISFLFYRFIKDSTGVTNQISAIRAGKAGNPLILGRYSLLSQAAEDLNTIEKGIEAAIEQSNRSNKMRVELITNVSHDLKTPLTSIINYADLLCEEGLEAPASEYAEALRNKAYRLKSMVQDVFDLSKATSGNLPVEKQKLDLAKLIRQTLADMDEKIQESTLTFKLSVSYEPLMIEADGERLYRVFQNLFNNALQYSLDHSRVHVQLGADGGFAYANIKSISREELNFSPDEIMERFVRADTSRSTEGSGLGLSIVQSFTEACGGIFTIDLNADLFTACVRFPLAPNVLQEVTNEPTAAREAESNSLTVTVPLSDPPTPEESAPEEPVPEEE